jgi:hypothetical protein
MGILATFAAVTRSVSSVREIITRMNVQKQKNFLPSAPIALKRTQRATEVALLLSNFNNGETK